MTELIQSPPDSLSTSVRDVTDELSLVAMNVDQMRVAQTQMAAWFRSKMDVLGCDLGETESALRIAEENGWQTSLFKSQIKRLTGRINFYEKCALASEAGYCIVPNMPCDLFAVRTTRNAPRNEEATSAEGASQVRSESPPAGQGEYVDDTAKVKEWTTSETVGTQERIKFHFRPTDFGDEIDFPISVAQSSVMSATAQAMALKVFDEMAVVDDGVEGSGVNGKRKEHARVKTRWLATNTRKGDPLVIGIIRNPDRTQWNDKRLSFLIGWHIDTRTL